MKKGALTDSRPALLIGVSAFARLPIPLLEELATLMSEERYPAGSVVVTEEAVGDQLYLIADAQKCRRPDRGGPCR